MTNNPFKQMDVIRNVSNEYIMRDKFQLTNGRAEYIKRCTFGSEEGNVKPNLETKKAHVPHPTISTVLRTQGDLGNGSRQGDT